MVAIIKDQLMSNVTSKGLISKKHHAFVITHPNVTNVLTALQAHEGGKKHTHKIDPKRHYAV